MRTRTQEPTEKLLWKFFLDSLDSKCNNKPMVFSLFLRQNINDELDLTIASNYGIPIDPFENAKKYAFINFVKYILIHTKNQHGISIDKKDFTDIFELIKYDDSKCRVLCYYELVENYYYIIIAVIKSIISNNDDLLPSVRNAFPFFKDYFKAKIEQKENNYKLNTTKLFIREIGHDMATQIQSINAKLRIIATRSSADDYLRRKADEARMDLLNAYALTDSLEITLNDEYSLRSENWFSLSIALNEVSSSLESEAREKEVDIIIKYDKEKTRDFAILGDKRAFKLCVQHILMNAVKYSHPSRTVEIFSLFETDRLVVSISNFSMIKLPSELERLDMYKFGKRTPQARKLHVNGSGMGLYTAKRIILAHEGTIWEKYGVDNRITFSVSIPKNRIDTQPVKRLENDITIVPTSYSHS